MSEGIEQLRCPSWGAARHDGVTKRPSWAEVEQAIRRLNGEAYNDVYLERPDQATWLAIGGGAGRFFVMLTKDAHTDGESWFVACRDDAKAGTESLTVGGQPGDYPARQIVGVDAVLDAAKAYFATGECSPALAWERS